MFDAITRWLKGGKGSKDIAKNRLQLILAYERTEISPEILDSLKEAIFAVISKYFVIKEDNVEMSLAKSEESVALMANIPILKMIRKPFSREMSQEADNTEISDQTNEQEINNQDVQ